MVDWAQSTNYLNYATLPSTTKTDWECESHHTYQTKHRHHRCFEIRCRTDQGQFCAPPPPPPSLWRIHYTPCKESLTYHWAPFYVYCCRSKTCSITLSLGELLQHSKVPVDISTKTVNYFKQTDDVMNKHPFSSDLKQGKISVLFLVSRCLQNWWRSPKPAQTQDLNKLKKQETFRLPILHMYALQLFH